jgi:hypothetical protein
MEMLPAKFELFKELVKVVMLKSKLDQKSALKYATSYLKRIQEKYPDLTYVEHISLTMKEIPFSNKPFEIEI